MTDNSTMNNTNLCTDTDLAPLEAYSVEATAKGIKVLLKWHSPFTAKFEKLAVGNKF